MALQRGLQKASKLLAAEVKAMAKPVESDDDIMNIAMIATGSEGMRLAIARFAAGGIVPAPTLRVLIGQEAH